MEILNLALIIAIILNFALGFLIYSRGPRNKVNISYAMISFCVSFWTIGQLIMRRAETANIAIFGIYIGYVGAIFIPSFLIYFSYLFPYKVPISLIKKIILVGSTVIILFLTAYPGLMIKGVIFHAWGKEIILGWFYNIYSAYFLLSMGWAIFNLYEKFKKTKKLDIERIQLKYVLGGLLPAATAGLIFNLILPWGGYYKLLWFGPIFTIILVIAIAYAIQKHHLLNIRVVATELFTGLINLIFLIQLIFAKNPQDLTVNGILFFLVMVFSYFLIKGALREVNELRRLSQAKSDFISIASHQLRSPLTVVKGYISMIIDGSFGEVSDGIKKILNKVFMSNESLIKLVEDLLNISRIEEGRLEFNFQKTNICDMIKSVVNEFAILAKNKNLELSFKQTFVPEINTDPMKIRQVIINLVDNAIKYTDSGSINIEVENKIKNNKKFVNIKVSDTGTGLSREEIANLFEKFNQGFEIQKIHPESNGLGLYIAKKIVEAHKGKIWAESAGRGKGSSFYVELPLG